MREQYLSVLKTVFYSDLAAERSALGLTQHEMSYLLAMDVRSYIELEHGNSCCGALTLARFLIYCCNDALAFLAKLQAAFELVDAA